LPPAGHSVSPFIQLWSRLGQFARSIIDLGTTGQPPDLIKPIRVCNTIAMAGFVIMMIWALVESWAGNTDDLAWELGLAIGFGICPLLNALGWHRLARVALILVANGTVFAGTVMFDKGSGGSLPFIAMIALPLPLSRPCEKWLFAVGAAAAVTLFAVCETDSATAMLGIARHPAPAWYFLANAASAFLCAFLFPLFYYRSNLRAEAELERHGRETLERLIHSSIIGVARAKIGGPILEANDALLDMLGYTREELRAGALNPKFLTAPEYAEDRRHAIAVLKERGVVPVFETQFMKKDGTPVPVMVGMAMLDAAQGDAIGFVLDITPKKAEEQQRQLLRESQEAIRMRDLFESVVSHELKTPLATVTLQTELAFRALEKGTDPETLKKHLQRCRASATKLGSLINTLLDSASIRQGKFELSLDDVDLTETAKSVVAGLEAGGLCPPGRIQVIAPAPVVGKWDPIRIDEVLTNLCSNAVKYGGDEPVEVHIGEDDGTSRARIEVVDHGMGIDDAMLSKIFNPFERAASTQHIQGRGLGLHVVRSIVEGHRGTIDVKSECGHGSRFIVELPRAPLT
jgi:PAS domain S-box-containing protein